jgi:hypothetical protein
MSETLKESIDAINNPAELSKLTAERLQTLSKDFAAVRTRSRESDADAKVIAENIRKLHTDINSHISSAADAKTKAAFEQLRDEITRTHSLDELVRNPGNAVDRLGLLHRENPAASTALAVGTGVGLLGVITGIVSRGGARVSDFIMSKIVATAAGAAAYFGYPYLREWYEKARKGREESTKKTEAGGEELKKLEAQLAKQTAVTDGAIKALTDAPATATEANRQIAEELRIINLLPETRRKELAPRIKTLSERRLTLGENLMAGETRLTIDGREYRVRGNTNGTLVVNGKTWKLQGFGTAGLAVFTINSARLVGNTINASIRGRVFGIFDTTKTPTFSESEMATLLPHLADRTDEHRIPSELTDGYDIRLIYQPPSS